MNKPQSLSRRVGAWRVLLLVAGLLGSAASYAQSAPPVGPQPPIYTGGTPILQTAEDFPSPFVVSLFDLFDRAPPTNFPDLGLSFALVSAPTPAGQANIGLSGALNSTLTMASIPDGFGAIQFTIRAFDNLNGTFTDVTFTLDVAPINDPPVPVGVIPSLTIMEDEQGVPPVDLSAGFSDIDSPSLSFTVLSRTPFAGVVGATVSGNALSLVTLPNEFGQVDFLIQADDGAGGIAQNTFALTVTPVPDPPRVENPVGTLTVLEDDPALRVALNSVFADDDDSVLSFSIENTAPAGILNPSIIGTDLVLQQVPNANGTVQVDFRATDSINQFVDTTLTLIITPVNDPPTVISAGNVVTHVEDEAGTLTEDASVWFNEVDANDTLTYAIQTVTGDTVLANPTISAAGLIGYSLIPNAFGSATITVEATDGGGESAVAQLAVNVTPVNDPPFVALAASDVTCLLYTSPSPRDRG